MDGDPVTGEPSKGKAAAASVTFTDVFVKLCPQYMAMGMSYHDYWHSNSSAHVAYREAYELRMKQEEWSRWRMGAYMYNTLALVSPLFRAFGKGHVEAGKYPEEPWPLTQKEADEREEAKRRLRFEQYLAHMNLESELEQAKRLKEANANAEHGHAIHRDSGECC